MIVSIVPIPNRYLRNSTIATNTGWYNYRALTIPDQLFLYKLSTLETGCAYEHIFASNAEIDPIGLTVSRFKHIVQKDEAYGGVLVPISVTRIDSSGRQTFLFPRCINFLFHSFTTGVPLDESSEIVDGPITSVLWPGGPGVAGISEFNFSRFHHSMTTQPWLGLTAQDRLFMSTLTPELPETISNYIDELLYLNLSGNQLVQYVSDVVQYENQTMFNLRDYLERFRYMYPLDPVTLECISTSSYIYGFQLRPYLADSLVMRSNSVLGYHPKEQLPGVSDLRYGCNAFDQIKLLEQVGLLEALINAPDSSFRLRVSRDSFLVESATYGLPAAPPSVYTRVVDEVRLTFANYPYESIELIRSPGEEVFISPIGPHGYEIPYYVNLAWYHLLSPSLINANLVKC